MPGGAGLNVTSPRKPGQRNVGHRKTASLAYALASDKRARGRPSTALCRSFRSPERAKRVEGRRTRGHGVREALSSKASRTSAVVCGPRTRGRPAAERTARGGRGERAGEGRPRAQKRIRSQVPKHTAPLFPDYSSSGEAGRGVAFGDDSIGSGAGFAGMSSGAAGAAGAGASGAGMGSAGTTSGATGPSGGCCSI